MKRLGAIAGFAIAVTLGFHAFASDHTNLEDEQPVSVTDAYATNYLNRELQAIVRYLRTDDGRNVFAFVPRFEVGFPRNAQLSVGMPFLAVTGERVYAGRANAELLYNLNEETLTLPALALVAAVDMPTGRDRDAETTHGFDPIARAYITKSIPGVSFWNRIHLNASYQYNVSRDALERRGRYWLAAGYSFRLSSSLIAVADVVREQRMLEHAVENYAELGLRYQATPLLVLAVGGGVGFADQSAPARVTASVQYRAF